MSFVDRLCEDLDIDQKFLNLALDKSRISIKQIIIPKREEGKFRIIRIPCVEAKIIQYGVQDILSKQIILSDFATAYFPGASVKYNAIIHAPHSHMIRIDLKDFFPSISFNDLKTSLTEQGIAIDADGLDVIRKVCFDVGDKLSIGFPISPFFCNVVMKKFDIAVNQGISEWGDMAYSRYSDDLVISSNTPEHLNSAKALLFKLILSWDSPKIKANFKKTRKMSIARGNAIITGVKIRPDHSLAVHPSIKKDATFLLNHCKKRTINDESVVRLNGLINYIKYIDPNLYNALMVKYYDCLAYLKDKITEALAKKSHALDKL